jgi:hypothetical protein
MVMPRLQVASAIALIVTAMVWVPAMGEGFLQRCGPWLKKKGYSVDYVEQRAGRRQPGFGRNWVSNIDRNAVQPGDVAIFVGPHDHVGYVEQVQRDASGKPVRILVADWNKPGVWVDESCAITGEFGKLNRWWADTAQVAKYWRPGL